MLNLAEYRRTSDRLADHLPWAAMVADGVLLNKDGSFSRILAFRGPDLESATEAELVSISARANNVLKRFGSGWALHIEAERREALGYPADRFPDAASWLVDEERRASFGSAGAHFESSTYARASNPFAEVGRHTVSVQVTSVVRASGDSFRIGWTEQAFERGSYAGTSRWTAVVTIKVRPPRSAETLRKNPLGLYVDAIDWSRELDTPPPQIADNLSPASASTGSPRTRGIPLGSPLTPPVGETVPPISVLEGIPQ